MHNVSSWLKFLSEYITVSTLWTCSPGGHCWNYHPGTLSSLWDHWNSIEDGIPVDFIGTQSFKWVQVTLPNQYKLPVRKWCQKNGSENTDVVFLRKCVWKSSAMSSHVCSDEWIVPLAEIMWTNTLMLTGICHSNYHGLKPRLNPPIFYFCVFIFQF